MQWLTFECKVQSASISASSHKLQNHRMIVRWVVCDLGDSSHRPTICKASLMQFTNYTCNVFTLCSDHNILICGSYWHVLVCNISTNSADQMGICSMSITFHSEILKHLMTVFNHFYLENTITSYSCLKQNLKSQQINSNMLISWP